MIPFQEVHGGDVDDEAAAGLQDAAHFPKRSGFRRIVQSINNVERWNEVEKCVRKREVRRGGLGDSPFSSTLRKREPGPCQVDSDRGTILSKQLEIVAGAASAIEDRRCLAAAYRVGEQRCHEAPESTEPEMILLGERGGLQESIHHADTIIDSVKTGR